MYSIESKNVATQLEVDSACPMMVNINTTVKSLEFSKECLMLNLSLYNHVYC